MEVFTLHRDTNEIGYCSHCIGCLYVSLGLCYGVLTLPETDSYTDTDTDSYNVQKNCIGTNTNSDADGK